MTAREAPRRARRGVLAVVLMLAWRYAAGHHMDGRRRTDATFLRRGTTAVAPRWFGVASASRWAMMPGWQRAVVRLAVLAALIGLWRARHVTEWALAVVGGPAVGVLAWLAWQRINRLRHHAGTVRPLAAALAPSLETTPAEAERTLAVPRGHDHPAAEVTMPLPSHWQGSAGQTDTVSRILGQRLGGEWVTRVSRSPLALIASHPPAPPGVVPFGQVIPLIRAQGSATRILMGLGAGDEPVWLDFGTALAHLGLSVGTGGGKSTFLRVVMAQFAYWGVASFPCLDAKGVSLAGMESLPGVTVYRDAADQWALITALRAEMESRYAELLASPSATFPLTVLLADEMNAAAIDWRARWDELRPPRAPVTPPVYADLTRLMITGRECGFRVIGSYQRLTAAACGGMNAGVLRDAYGTKALARFSPQAWDSLVGIRPRPASSQTPGRWVVAAGHDVRAVQVPNADADELLAFVASSPHAATGPSVPVPVPPVAGPVSRGGAPGRDRDMGQAERPASAAGVPSPESGRGPVVVGLEAGAAFAGVAVEAFRKRRQRRGPVPGEYRTADGRPAWPRAELAAWLGVAEAVTRAEPERVSA